jgi:hypothetical protein
MLPQGMAGLRPAYLANQLPHRARDRGGRRPTHARTSRPSATSRPGSRPTTGSPPGGWRGTCSPRRR